jgi:predicted permease
MWGDFLQTGRTLRRRWKTTLAVVLLLGSGVAGVAALFAIVDGLLWRPLPFPGQDRLVAIGARGGAVPGPGPLTHGAIAALAETRWADVAGYAPPQVAEQAGGDVLRVTQVTPGFFRVLHVTAAAGVLLDERHADTSAIVLSHDAWVARYGGHPDAVGRHLEWNGRTYTIVGIAPRGVDFPLDSEAWTLAARPPRPEAVAAFRAVGRLPAGESLASVQARFPDLSLLGLREWIKPGGTFGLVMLLAAAALVLGVAWVQVAALQAGRAAEDRLEMNVRVALGASRGQLMRRAAAEATWLGLATFAVASCLTPIFTNAIVGRLPATMTRGQAVAVDVRVLLGAGLISVIGVLLCTLAPRVQGWGDTYLAQLRAVPDRRRVIRARNGLLLVQVSVAVPLVYLASVTWLSSTRLAATDLGFDPKGLVVVRLPSSAVPVPGGDAAVRAARRAILRDLKAVPGVHAVATGSAAPFGSRTSVPLTLGASRTDESLAALHTVVDAEYFATLGIPLRRGRTFLDSDRRDSPLVVVVSEFVASRLRRAGRDVGSHVLVAGLPAMVVGVVADVRDSVHPADVPEARVYVCADQWPPPSFLYIRVGVDAGVIERLRNRLAEAWPHDRLSPSPVEDRIVLASADYRGRSVILSLLAATAIGLTTLGVFGGVSGIVKERTRETAIRIVCGASPARIAAQVVLAIMGWVGAGAATGLSLGWIAARALESLLFQTGALDPLAVGAALLALPALAMVVALGPAWRATRIAPADALRD